jgi:S-adenosylmethionine uptake transporter
MGAAPPHGQSRDMTSQPTSSRQPWWMLAAAFVFALMGVCVKFAAEHYSAVELVAYRGLVSVVITLVWARSTGVSLRTERPGMHLWRGAVGVFSLGTWFYALAFLPIATAMTLNYMSSVWVAAFLAGGALLYGKNEGSGWLYATVLAGFAGVVMVLRPALEANQLWPGLMGLLSGMTAALAYLQVTALSRAGEPDLRVVFYFALAAAVMGCLGMLVLGYSAWSARHALWILPIGVLASMGQLFMTRAYGSGSTLLVANLQYSGIVFAAVMGMVFFADRLPLMAWTGMLLIISSGIAATMIRAKTLPGTPAEDHS